MSSLLEVTRSLGVSKMLDSRRARRVAWEDIIAVHFVTRCFQALLNLGVLDEMRRQNWLDVTAHAQQQGLDGRLLTAVCDALYSRSMLKKDAAGRFALEESSEFLVTNALSRGWFNLANGYENVLFHLEDLVRGSKKYGVDVVRDGELVGVGSGLASRDFYFPLVLDKLAQLKVKRVLDIGSGDGEFLRLVCRRFPAAEGVGLDLSPAAVEAGRASVRASGLDSRIQLHVGDAMRLASYRKELTGVDAAATFFVLHELCDGGRNERALAFLRAFRETLPGVPFLITETVRPTAAEMRDRPGPAIEYFLFHDLSGQHPVDRDTWRHLFEEAGFQKIEEDYISFARTAIFTIR